MQKVNGKFIVRIETCVDCGDEFMIDLEEFIQKTESRMRLPQKMRSLQEKTQMRKRSVCWLAFDTGKISSN